MDQTYTNYYINSISKLPVLSAEREKELAYKIKQGERTARDELYKCNLRFVVKVANTFSKNGDTNDLIQEGNIGLMTAIDKYDPSRGYRFLTYAVWWIKEPMRRFIEKNKTIRLPHHIVERRRRINQLIEDYVIKNGFEPTYEEIAKTLTLQSNNQKDSYIAKDIETILENANQVETLSFNMIIGEKNDTELIDLISDNKNSTDIGINHLIAKQTRQYLVRYINNLPPKEKIIIEKHYLNELTLTEIGEEFNLTKERIRQISEDGLKKIKKQMKKEKILLNDLLF